MRCKYFPPVDSLSFSSDADVGTNSETGSDFKTGARFETGSSSCFIISYALTGYSYPKLFYKT